MSSEDETPQPKKKQKNTNTEGEDLPRKKKKKSKKCISNRLVNESDLESSEEMSPRSSKEVTEKPLEIGDLLKDINDLNEPSCMDKILFYLEELNEEDLQFMELLIEKLHEETITWEQPWYQQSNSLSRPLKESNNEKHQESYRTDTICKAESELILENWKEFREIYEIPDKLICLARWRNKEKSRLPSTPEEHARRFVVAFLARGLQRTIYQVFRHIMTSFGGPNKGAYSAEEEKIMEICFTHRPNHAVTILSMVLGREPRGIYKRLQQMFNGKPEKKKLKWTVPLANKLLKLLLKYTHIPLEQLKYTKIDKSIWLKLEKKFDHHYIHLQAFWYDNLHVQVFVQDNLKINKLRRQVFKRLKSSPSYQVWTDIRWKDFVKQFSDGITHRFLYGVARRVVCDIPGYLKKPLSEISDYALIKLAKHKYRKRRLKRLQINEKGELEIVTHQSSKS